MGGTDCAQPMLYAKRKQLDVDVFIVYTDNETWAGKWVGGAHTQAYTCRKVYASVGGAYTQVSCTCGRGSYISIIHVGGFMLRWEGLMHSWWEGLLYMGGGGYIQAYQCVRVYTHAFQFSGAIHPSEALKQYWKASGIDAKLIVCGMCANSFSIADPNDAGMLDMAGFDSAAPQVIQNFVAGEI